jgi:hypothetical protein
MVEPSGVRLRDKIRAEIVAGAGLVLHDKCAGRVFLLQAIGYKARDDVPGPKGTTIRTVFVGQSCATAVVARASTARNALTACFAVRNAASTFIEG